MSEPINIEIDLDKRGAGIGKLAQAAQQRMANGTGNGASSASSAFSAPRQRQWPVLAEKAYYGLAGIVVKTIEPHSEADPAALLIQFLVCAGNLIGRRFYYPVEGDRHHANLFTLLIGISSKGRKGTSFSRIMSVMKGVDKDWAEDRNKSGLSSGEGLINEVRDRVEKQRSGETAQVIDEGVTENG